MSEKYQYNKKYVEKHLKENYDEIKVRVPKGLKAIIKERLDASGESLNGYINRLIEDDMDETKEE